MYIAVISIVIRFDSNNSEDVSDKDKESVSVQQEPVFTQSFSEFGTSNIRLNKIFLFVKVVQYFFVKKTKTVLPRTRKKIKQKFPELIS